MEVVFHDLALFDELVTPGSVLIPYISAFIAPTTTGICIFRLSAHVKTL